MNSLHCLWAIPSSIKRGVKVDDQRPSKATFNSRSLYMVCVNRHFKEILTQLSEECTCFDEPQDLLETSSCETAECNVSRMWTSSSVKGQCDDSRYSVWPHRPH